MNKSQIYSLQDLFTFVDIAGKSTYAAGLPPLKKSERKDFFEYVFTQGDWDYKDSYVGHTKSAGQEIVRYKNEVIWNNSYCGGMTEGNYDLANVTFTFLKEALSQDDNTFNSLRGPKHFKKNVWEYRYSQDGTIEDYYGLEQIFYEGELVFFHRAIGGTVINN